MTTAKEILELIEAVDPKDAVKMGEIDKRASSYVIFKQGVAGHWLCDPPKLTSSRDALKAIRPEGWTFQMFANSESGDLEYFGQLTRDNPYAEFTSPDMPTEELAELHAIIQSIEYERTKS